MAAKKPTAGHYLVLRDFAEFMAGDVIEMDDATVALLLRDGFVVPAQED